MTGIVVGAERTPEGRAAVRWALQQAAVRELPLYVVRAWSDAMAVGFAAGAVLATDPDWAEQEAARTAQSVVHEAGSDLYGVDEVDVRISPVRGAAGTALVHAAAGQALLVVGTRRAGPFRRVLLGSVTEHVLHHASCPVAVLPAPELRTNAPPRVVVGVDHSPASLSALAWAANEAERHGRVLVPVAVRDGAWTGPTAGGLPLQEVDLEGAELRSLRRAVPPDVHVRVEPDVITGPAGKALAQYAEPQDVVVVGSRGRGAAASTLLGSTSSFLAEHAHCPVVVVRAGQAG